MPRKKICTQLSGPYHVTLRSINKEWFNLPMDDVWLIFQSWLYLTKHAFNLEIHSFVLMNNHYHMLISTPHGNLSEALMYFHREVSLTLNRNGNRINRNFAGPFYKCHIGCHHHFVNCYKYVYQNPIRAGIVRLAQDYPFSTLSGLLGARQLLIPLVEDKLLFEHDLNKNLGWLNQPINDSNLAAIRGALRKAKFNLRRDLNTKKPNILETSIA